MILRAPTSWLTALQAYAAQLSLNSTKPPSQLNSAAASQFPVSGISAAINPGAQTISAPGYGPCTLTVPAAVTRALAGPAAANMPTESLSLSQECCIDAQGMWPAVFQALGFTTGFTPTITPVPTLNC